MKVETKQAMSSFNLDLSYKESLYDPMSIYKPIQPAGTRKNAFAKNMGSSSKATGGTISADKKFRRNKEITAQTVADNI